MERDIRFGVGSVVVWSLWLVAVGILIGSRWVHDDGTVGRIGLAVSGLAAAMTVIRDNVKTRRAIRAVIRDGLWPPVRDFGRRGE